MNIPQLILNKKNSYVMKYWFDVERVRSILPRDSRPNALNKDVPSFLVYPDGSHSLGVISPAATRSEEDSG